MYELPIQGEIKTLAYKEGSSGIFTGPLAGMYQGYRFASTTPDERDFVLDLPNGTIALTIKQEIRSLLTPRPAEHPFADGVDPFDNMPPESPGGPSHGAPGGPPSGATGGGPPGLAGGPPPGAAGGPPGGPRGLVGGRPFYMEVMATVDPAKCTGIFANSTGQIEINAPDYDMAGHLIINTKHGDLHLDFLESGGRGVLNANLRVNGEHSTGIYRNARGDLTFSLKTVPPNFGRGPYSGTLWLEQAPPAI